MSAQSYDVYFSGLGNYVQVDKKGVAKLNGATLNLANYATGVLKSGVLTVTGTNGNDNLKFAQVSGKIYISGVSGSFSASKVKSIVVRLQDGNDSVSLDSLANGGNQALAEAVTDLLRSGHRDGSPGERARRDHERRRPHP